MPVTKLWRVVVIACVAGMIGCSNTHSTTAPTPPTPPATVPPPVTGVAPSITSQPASQSVSENLSATLTVVAEGTAPLVYQWYVGDSGSTASVISGGTSASLTTGPMSATVKYWVRVTNAYGAANSSTATVTMVPTPPSDPNAALEDLVVTLINARRAAGAVCGSTTYPSAVALVHNAKLRNAARAHSLDMGTQGYFSHTSLDGRTFSQRISAAGYTGPTPWGENIAAGYATAQSVVDGWMASPGHCTNIMNGSFRGVGVGYAFVASSPYGYYWTQDFGAGQ